MRGAAVGVHVSWHHRFMNHAELIDDLIIRDVVVTRVVEQDVLRYFAATIELYDRYGGWESGFRPIGRVAGLVAWLYDDDDICDAADQIDDDATTLAWNAEEIREWLLVEHDIPVETIVTIDMIRLEPAFRGHRLTAQVMGEVLDVLRLDPRTTLIVAIPYPQQEDGGPMPTGRASSAAFKRLKAAYTASGFRRWRRTSVWWRCAGLPLQLAGSLPVIAPNRHELPVEAQANRREWGRAH